LQIIQSDPAFGFKLRKIVRASRNPPSVLCGIPLSSQPEQVQDPFALFGLAPPGSAVSFHDSESSGFWPSPWFPGGISFLFRGQPSPANHR